MKIEVGGSRVYLFPIMQELRRRISLTVFRRFQDMAHAIDYIIQTSYITGRGLKGYRFPNFGSTLSALQDILGLAARYLAQCDALG